MKKIILFTLLVVSCWLSVVGSTQAAQDSGIYSYIFHLYYDNGKLVADRDFTTPFDLLAEAYSPSTWQGEIFLGEIYSINNKRLSSFNFDLGNISGPTGQGRLAVHAPYFDNAKWAKFYNRQDQLLLTIDLAPAGPVCNENGICDTASGESRLNCPTDCQAVVPSSVLTPSVTPVGGPDLNRLIGPLIYLLIGGAIIGLLWFLRRYLNRNNDVTNPPL